MKKDKFSTDKTKIKRIGFMAGKIETPDDFDSMDEEKITAMFDPDEKMKRLLEELEAMRSPEYKDATDEEIAAIIDDLYDGL